jgi:hypothetical protein
LYGGYTRVKVGLGIGMWDGGNETTWPSHWLPIAARWPGAEFTIRGFDDQGVPQFDEKPDIANSQEEKDEYWRNIM